MPQFNIYMSGSTSPYQFSVDNINFNLDPTINVASNGTYNVYAKGNDNVVALIGSVVIQDSTSFLVGYVSS